jgi:N utilization substance protein A
MRLTLDTETIKTISLFQNLTGTHVKDIIEVDDSIYVVVSEGEYGLAVGKDGQTIRKAEGFLKKTIKIFEYSQNMEQFVRNMIPEAQQISIIEKTVRVRIPHNVRARVIGRAGNRAKVIGSFLERLHDVTAFKVQ